jgi:hypothetical protein
VLGRPSSTLGLLSLSSLSPSLSSSPSSGPRHRHHYGLVLILVVPSSSSLTPLSSDTRRCPCPCLIGVLSFAPCRPRFRALVVLSSLSPPHCPLPRLGPRCCRLLPRRVPGGGWGRCCGVVALLSLPRRVIVAPRYSGWVAVVVVASLGMGLSFWRHCVIVTQLDPLD